MEHINKKHKADIIVNNEGNNNNNKIIVLPIIIQKYILELLYESLDYENNSYKRFGYQKCQGRKFNLQINDQFYALVNWFWFKKCQSLLSRYTQFKYTKKQIGKELNSKYKIMNKSVIENISIHFLDISSTLVNEINSFSSLKSLEVNNFSNYGDSWLGDSVWLLNHLNKLNDGITVNFNLCLWNPGSYIENKDLNVEKEIFKFKVGYFKVEFDHEIDNSYGFLYEIIKDLQFKSFYFHSESNSDSGATHLEQYHSISKLNQNVKSVVIRDYIPLYALYRFLKAPKLRTLKFRLQFHFLSSIYGKNKENINDNSMVSFGELDTFQFKNFKEEDEEDEEYRVHSDMKYYIENGINEDNQIYCSYSRQDYSDDTIPPYSKLLLDECLKLLKNNTTITHLKISSDQCGGCRGVPKFSFDDQLFNDLFDSLSENKTIKELYLEFGFIMYDWERNGLCHLIGNQDTPGLLEPKIAMMLDQNKTLEYLYLGHRLNVAQVSKLTTNTKCKLISK